MGRARDCSTNAMMTCRATGATRHRRRSALTPPPGADGKVRWRHATSLPPPRTRAHPTKFRLRSNAERRPPRRRSPLSVDRTRRSFQPLLAPTLLARGVIHSRSSRACAKRKTLPSWLRGTPRLCPQTVREATWRMITRHAAEPSRARLRAA